MDGIVDDGLNAEHAALHGARADGADVLKEIVMAADEIRIRALTVYGFSTGELETS